jgi:putative membrane protein
MLLLFSQPNLSFVHVANLDMIATEIVRSLIGSIGLLFAIPITAYATAFLVTRPAPKERLHRRTPQENTQE